MIAQQDSAASESPRVGDTVVYAAHGIGRVVALEQQQVGETERECIVVDLATGLRVTLPLEEAGARLRTVADKNEIENVRRTLNAESSALDRQWKTRVTESKAKLASGRPTELAELVRDGSRFERMRGSQLSHGERRLYLQARELLIREISAARELEQDEAETWIEAQISSSDRNED